MIIRFIIHTLFLLVFPFTSVLSQTVKWSSPVDLNEGAIYPSVIGKSNGNIFTQRLSRDRNEDLVIDKYSKQLNRLNQIILSFNRKDRYYKSVLHNNSLYVLYSSETGKPVKLNFFALEYDLNLKRQGEPVLLHSIDIEDKIPKIRIQGSLEKLYFTHAKFPIQEKMEFNTFILDSSLASGTQLNYKIPIEKEIRILQQLLVGNKLFMLIQEINEKKNARNYIHLFQYDFKNELIGYIPLKNDSLHFLNASMSHDRKNNGIIVNGLYGHEDSSLAKGIGYYYKGFEAGSKTIMKFTQFQRSFLLSMQGRGKKRYGLANHKIKALIPSSDGGSVLITESQYLSTETYNDISIYGITQTYTRDVYHNGNVIVTSVDSLGEIRWSNFIRKTQESVNDEGYYSSICIAISKGKIRILFNDLSRKRWNLMLHSIDPLGQTNADILVNGSKVPNQLVPRAAKQISNEELVIPGFEKNDDYIIMKLTY